MICRCITWIKKHPVLSLFFLILMYLVIGATAPFYHYKPISQETQDTVSAENFYQEGDSRDRAMILETNQSAWDERMRLMNLARERIILSTFDFRDGESPRDLMAVMLHKADQGVSIKILVDGFSGLVRMEPSKLFYALSSHPNIEIKIYNKMNPLLPWKTQGRMHDKYVIVDDYGYILGGRNTFDYFIGSIPRIPEAMTAKSWSTIQPTAQTGERTALCIRWRITLSRYGIWMCPPCSMTAKRPETGPLSGTRRPC